MSLLEWKKLAERKSKTAKAVKKVNKEITEHKIKKGASRDLYQDFLKPVSTELEKQTKKLQTLPAIQQQLQALPQAIGEEITPDPYGIQSLYAEAEPQPALPKPRYDVDLDKEVEALMEKEKQKPITANLDEGIDYETLNYYKNIMKLSNAPSKTKEELNKELYEIKNTIKSETGIKSSLSKKSLDLTKVNKRIKALQEYRDRLDSIIKNYDIIGKGLQPKRHAYKMSSDGTYGNLKINVPELVGHHKLIAKQGGSVILNEKVDNDFIDLITKRYNKNKIYSNSAKENFKKLTKQSGLPIHQTSLKYDILCDNVKYYNNPNELMDKLELICGSLQAGNNSPQMINQGINIIDELLKLGKINQSEHEKLYMQYFNNGNV